MIQTSEHCKLERVLVKWKDEPKSEVGVLLGRSLLGRVDVEMRSLKLSTFSIPCYTLEGFHTPSENTKRLT